MNKFFNKVKNNIKNKEIINLYKTNNNKNVLISYIVSPLKINNKYSHSNQQELISITELFRDLGFNVDIYHFLSDKNIDYSKYSLLFGFGNPFSNSFKNNNLKRIYYGTGAHPYFQNFETLKRVSEFYKKKGKWLLESSRKVDFTWPEQLQLADFMILLGNKKIKETYSKYFRKKIFLLNASYNQYLNQLNTNRKSTNKSKKSYLYFTSNGALHRSLDLLIEYFKKHPDLNLYIASNLNKEKEFLNIYDYELDLPNINYFGHIKINSQKYLNLINQCDFTILPTCSEGQSTSLINMMRSGLIPITTDYSGLDNLDDTIRIKNLDEQNIEKVILTSQKLSHKEIDKKRANILDFSLKNYSLENYKNNLKKILLEIINEK